MRWRDEIEALIGVPAVSPAAVVTLDGAAVRYHDVAPGSSTLQLTNPAGAATRTRTGSTATLPMRDGAMRWIAVSFLRDQSGAETRRMLVMELARVLGPGGTLVVADHNRPRGPFRAVLATVLPPRSGLAPIAAWRRLAYPAAREIAAAGFVIDRLRLAVGERVQVVWATRASSPIR